MAVDLFVAMLNVPKLLHFKNHYVYIVQKTSSLQLCLLVHVSGLLNSSLVFLFLTSRGLGTQQVSDCCINQSGRTPRSTPTHTL